MKLCDRCLVSCCYLDYLGEACNKARKKHCADVRPNNAEIITNMNASQLADFLYEVKSGLLDGKGILTYEDIKAWLLSDREKAGII